MNLPIATVEPAAPMAWHLMVESLADGQVAGFVEEGRSRVDELIEERRS